MSEFAKSLVVEQRKRLVGSLMDYLEKQVFPQLPSDAARKALRDKVMSSVGSYHDVMLDVIKASVNDGSMVNDEALALLQRIADGQQRLLGRDA